MRKAVPLALSFHDYPSFLRLDSRQVPLTNFAFSGLTGLTSFSCTNVTIQIAMINAVFGGQPPVSMLPQPPFFIFLHGQLITARRCLLETTPLRLDNSVAIVAPIGLLTTSIVAQNIVLL